MACDLAVQAAQTEGAQRRKTCQRQGAWLGHLLLAAATDAAHSAGRERFGGRELSSATSAGQTQSKRVPTPWMEGTRLRSLLPMRNCCVLHMYLQAPTLRPVSAAFRMTRLQTRLPQAARACTGVSASGSLMAWLVRARPVQVSPTMLSRRRRRTACNSEATGTAVATGDARSAKRTVTRHRASMRNGSQARRRRRRATPIAPSAASERAIAPGSGISSFWRPPLSRSAMKSCLPALDST